MLVIMRVFLFVISTPCAISQNKPASDNYDLVENKDFYDEITEDDSENIREKRDLVENPEFYEEFPSNAIILYHTCYSLQKFHLIVCEDKSSFIVQKTI